MDQKLILACIITAFLTALIKEIVSSAYKWTGRVAGNAVTRVRSLKASTVVLIKVIFSLLTATGSLAFIWAHMFDSRPATIGMTATLSASALNAALFFRMAVDYASDMQAARALDLARLEKELADKKAELAAIEAANNHVVD